MIDETNCARAPWRARSEGEYLSTDVFVDGRDELGRWWVIAGMRNTVGDPQDNARMMAAAPDMAEALRALIEYCEITLECHAEHGMEDDLPGLVEDARVALRKAGDN